jgi:hypothetical protein
VLFRHEDMLLAFNQRKYTFDIKGLNCVQINHSHLDALLRQRSGRGACRAYEDSIRENYGITALAQYTYLAILPRLARFIGIGFAPAPHAEVDWPFHVHGLFKRLFEAVGIGRADNFEVGNRTHNPNVFGRMMRGAIVA